MLGALAKRFMAAGVVDKLAPRRLQEQADLHRLFVLTQFYKLPGNGETHLNNVLDSAKAGELLRTTTRTQSGARLTCRMDAHTDARTLDSTVV